MGSQDFEHFKGTLVERAAASITQGYEEDLRRPLAGVKLLPFDSARQGTWTWMADRMKQGDHEFTFPQKVIVDFSPDAVAVITVWGTAEDGRPTPNEDLAGVY